MVFESGELAEAPWIQRPEERRHSAMTRRKSPGGRIASGELPGKAQLPNRVGVRVTPQRSAFQVAIDRLLRRKPMTIDELVDQLSKPGEGELGHLIPYILFSSNRFRKVGLTWALVIRSRGALKKR
jgi:hypothetical protein